MFFKYYFQLYKPIITVLYCFKSFFFSFTFIMVDDDIKKYENNVARILERAVNLFHDTDLPELAEKWDKILKNYYRKRSFR